MTQAGGRRILTLVPCPPDTPITGNSSVSAYGFGAAEAIKAAKAAVPSAAEDEARNACNCPPSCPVAAPYGVNSTVTGTSSSYVSGFSLIVDVFTLGLGALFGDGFYCRAWADFSWTATAHCAERADGRLE